MPDETWNTGPDPIDDEDNDKKKKEDAHASESQGSLERVEMAVKKLGLPFGRDTILSKAR